MQYGTSVSELKQARAAGAPARLPDPGPRFSSALVIWVWLFLVCFGLGYVTLNRLDPRNLPGTLDTADYYQMVAGSRRDVEPLMGSRILVAAVARPIARLANGHLGSWNPIWFGLLVANSLFSATAGYVLLLIGIEVTGNAGLAWVSVLAYLLSFPFANRLLIGFIDSAEACLILLVVWAPIRDCWWQLPVYGVSGALAKESFVPIATVMAFTWYLAETRKLDDRKQQWRRLMYVTLMGIAGVGVVTALQSSLAGQLVTPWKFAGSLHHGGYVAGLLESITARKFWYTFGWPLGLGIWRLRKYLAPGCGRRLQGFYVRFCSGHGTAPAVTPHRRCSTPLAPCCVFPLPTSYGAKSRGSAARPFACRILHHRIYGRR